MKTISYSLKLLNRFNFASIGAVEQFRYPECHTTAKITTSKNEKKIKFFSENFVQAENICSKHNIKFKMRPFLQH